MELGQIVDYCTEWNEARKENLDESEEPKIRDATQADWDNFFGG